MSWRAFGEQSFDNPVSTEGPPSCHGETPHLRTRQYKLPDAGRQSV